MKLQFLGANRQVTGSRYFLQAGGMNILIDCGMFQERDFLDRNWQGCPIACPIINCLLLTHAHLDHCGLIPRLVKIGFVGRVYATSASIELSRLVMEDAARLQEQDIKFKQERHEKEGRKNDRAYEALYGVGDVDRAMLLFHKVKLDEPLKLNEQVSVTYHEAGHILGSTLLEVSVRENGQARRLVFSGDLGQWNKPLIRDPTLLDEADYIVMESTYGDKDHDTSQSIEDQLERIVNETAARGGAVVIPTFAIERAQELMFYFSRLVRAKRVRQLPVFLDSPMALDATDIFRRHGECLDPEVIEMFRAQDSPFSFPGLILSRTRDQSKAINAMQGPCVIMAGSGMCTGGRIKHHLVRHIVKPESTLLFVGFQSRNTLGRQIQDSRPGELVRILGQHFPVHAKIEKLLGLSAHADRSGLLRWAGHFRKPPRQLFLTHGEEEVSLALAATVKQKLGWGVTVPEYEQVVELE